MARPKPDFSEVNLTLELKEKILLKPCIRLQDIMLLTGFGKSTCYNLMTECKKFYGGKAGLRTDAITPKSLCLALGTTIEEEMRLIGIAKGYIVV